MLINFEFGNFKSFRDATKLNMRATTQRTYNDSLIRKDNLKILPSAVIYGANASGKTSIVAALRIMREIVLNGGVATTIRALENLELCPFVHDDNNMPLFFSIEFVNKGKHLYYAIKVQCEKFTRGKRSIVYEKLEEINDKVNKTLFLRKPSSLEISEAESTSFMSKMSKEQISELMDSLINNLDSEDLFLTHGYKGIVDNSIAEAVIDFFAQSLFVYESFPQGMASLSMQLDDGESQNIAVWNSMLEDFVKKADFGPQQIMYKPRNNAEKHSSVQLDLISVYKHGKFNTVIPSKLIESNGTIKLLEFAVPFEKVFKEGGIFVIDEFDSALHPEIVKGIISLYNNPQININGSQLIITTHNPIFMSKDLFRRDQIWFTEKDRTSYMSTLFSLADFGSEQVRNDENYMINYFKGKYTAMPYIDFGKIIKGQ